MSTSQGLTPAIFAAKYSRYISLQILLDVCEVSISQQDNNGNTILAHVLQTEPFDHKLAKRLIN